MIQFYYLHLFISEHYRSNLEQHVDNNTDVTCRNPLGTGL